MPAKLSQEEFIQRAKEIHHNKYDYSPTEFTGVFNKVKIICSVHGVFEQEVHVHLRGGGCQKCHWERNLKRLAGGKLSQNEFIKKAKEKHNNKYDYSKAIYSGTDNKMKIICPIHGCFKQSAHIHLKGAGCKKCGYDTVSKKLSRSEQEFLKMANRVHKNKYDYSLVKYRNENHCIKIICRIHGVFIRTGRAHLSGIGCHNCSGYYKKLTKSMFINKSNKIHNKKYSYSKIASFANNRSKVKIVCPTHGVFIQKVISHLNGHGCPVCARSISKSELKWLSINNIPNDNLHRHLTLRGNGKKFLVDGYIPETNTIYEFYGDFWHGYPFRYNRNDINCVVKKTFGELYDKTIKREENMKAAGYKLITIWESDFKKKYPN